MCAQSYDAKFLKIYSELPPTPLQLEEDLEQLKVLENEYKMKVPIIICLQTFSSLQIHSLLSFIFLLGKGNGEWLQYICMHD